MSETEKRKQFHLRQRFLHACIPHANYGDAQENIAPYLFEPSELEEIEERARRIFLDYRRIEKSTCHWVSSESVRNGTSAIAFAFLLPGESKIWAGLISDEATFLEEAILPQNSDGTVLLGSKAYYFEFIPAVDMKVVSLGGISMWESIINARMNKAVYRADVLVAQ